MLIAGALAVGTAEASGLGSVVLYAAVLRFIVLGALVALLVVAASLLLALIVGAAAGRMVLRASFPAGLGRAWGARSSEGASAAQA